MMTWPRLRHPRRDDRLGQIERLDPETDFEEIFRLVTAYEFPWDFWQSASLAFFRTFGIPSIARLLDETGEIVRHTQKRADDTLLILFEISRLGLETNEGRAYLRRMNQIHHRYSIDNADSLYIIALYVTVPVDWINQYGWRRLTVPEQRALAYYGRRLAQLMGVKHAPATLPEFVDYVRRYEDSFLAYSDSARRLAEASLAISADMLPPPLRRPLGPVMRRFSLAILAEPLVKALGLPSAPVRDRRLAEAMLRVRAMALRLFPPRPNDRPHRLSLATYPTGHTLADVGPAWIGTHAAHPSSSPGGDT